MLLGDGERKIAGACANVQNRIVILNLQFSNGLAAPKACRCSTTADDQEIVFRGNLCEHLSHAIA